MCLGPALPPSIAQCCLKPHGALTLWLSLRIHISFAGICSWLGWLNSTCWSSVVLLAFVICQRSVPIGEKSHCLLGDKARLPLCRTMVLGQFLWVMEHSSCFPFPESIWGHYRALKTSYCVSCMWTLIFSNMEKAYALRTAESPFLQGSVMAAFVSVTYCYPTGCPQTQVPERIYSVEWVCGLEILGWAQLSGFSSGLAQVIHAAVVTWHFNWDLDASCHWASLYMQSFAYMEAGAVQEGNGGSFVASWGLDFGTTTAPLLPHLIGPNPKLRIGEIGSSLDRGSCTILWPCLIITVWYLALSFPSRY